MNFTLNFQALNGIPFQKYSNDFTFIVNGKRYSTPRIVADLLSPKIRKFHFTDESVTEIHINTNQIKSENQTQTDYFSDFLQLCTDNQVNLDSTRQEIYSQYFYQLGNINEYFRIQSEMLNSISIENAVNQLLTIDNITKEISEEIDRSLMNINQIISFIANHFEDIEKEELKQLPIDKLNEIILSDSFQISNEDSLLTFILDLYEEDHSYSVLFEGVLFSNLSENLLKKFVNEFEFEDLNVQVWNSICQRLFQLKKNTKNQRRYLQKVVKPTINSQSTLNQLSIAVQLSGINKLAANQSSIKNQL